eukprot:gene6105-7608_t
MGNTISFDYFDDYYDDKNVAVADDDENKNIGSAEKELEERRLKYQLRIKEELEQKGLIEDPEKLKRHRSAIIIQKVWKGYRQRRKWTLFLTKTQVLKELLITEQDYVQYLKIIISVYMIPLRNLSTQSHNSVTIGSSFISSNTTSSKSRLDYSLTISTENTSNNSNGNGGTLSSNNNSIYQPPLSLDEVKIVFSQIEVILSYNSQLLDKLKERVRSGWQFHQQIGDIFLEMIDFLKVPYSHYIINFPACLKVLENASKRPSYVLFIQQCKSIPEVGRRDLQSFISMPIQRIPRYVLLLRELLKYTGSSDADFGNINNALKRTETIAELINKQMKEDETSKEVISISLKLRPEVPNLVQPHRKLIREGQIKMYKADGNNHEVSTGTLRPTSVWQIRDPKIRHIYLFNDCVIVTKKMKNYFRVDHVVNLDYSTVIDHSKRIKIVEQKETDIIDVDGQSQNDTSTFISTFNTGGSGNNNVNGNQPNQRPGDRYYFKLHTLEWAVVICLPTEEEKNKWRSDFENVINQIIENRLSFNPKWSSNDFEGRLPSRKPSFSSPPEPFRMTTRSLQEILSIDYKSSNITKNNNNTSEKTTPSTSNSTSPVLTSSSTTPSSSTQNTPRGSSSSISSNSSTTTTNNQQPQPQLSTLDKILKKIKVISRSEEEETKETSTDVRKLHRNLNPALHPLERPREYVRALNSVKLDRLFAKPFIGSLTGHTDGIFSMTRHPTTLNCVASGSCDGIIKLWNLSLLNERTTIKAHDGFVRGVTFSTEGKILLSCGEDKTIKIWGLSTPEYTSDNQVISVFNGKNAFTSIDHQRNTHTFATSSINVEIWKHERSVPIQTLSWGYTGITKVKFNPIETDLLASCTSERAIILYDIRQNSPAQKLITNMRSNSIAWNPTESYMIALANEDENVYQYDIRNLNKAITVHRDHVGPVLDVDYSPTGKEFVTGSYDKTIRIFPVETFKSREVYYTNRMQRIFSVLYTGDSRFVLSGSDDMNIRIWKAQASVPLGIMTQRETEKLQYQDKLKEKFKEIPEIKTIANHRRVPKTIYKKKYIKNEIHKAKNRKLQNMQKNSGSKAPSAPKPLSAHSIVVEK